jgi:hypothetical protein
MNVLGISGVGCEPTIHGSTLRRLILMANSRIQSAAKTVRLLRAHWKTSKQLSSVFWERVIFTRHLLCFRGKYEFQNSDPTRIQRAAVTILENAMRSIYDRQSELLLQGLIDGEEAKGNSESFVILGEAMRRVDWEHDTDERYDYKNAALTANDLIFPIPKWKN